MSEKKNDKYLTVKNKLKDDLESFMTKGTVKSYLIAFEKLLAEMYPNNDVQKLIASKSNKILDCKKMMSTLMNKNDFKLSTKKRYTGAYLNVVKKLFPEDKYKDKVQCFQNEYNAIAKYDLTSRAYKMASEKDLKNYVTEKEINDKFIEYKNKLHDKIYRARNDQPYLILAFLKYLFPLRNEEYLTPVIYKRVTKKMEHSPNYIDLHNGELVITYQKSRKVGERRIVLPKELLNIIKQQYEKSGSKYLFPKSKNTDVPMRSNHFTRMLNDIFDKNASTTLLRKAYISRNVDKLNADERKKLARNMGHSAATQITNYSAFDKKLHPELKSKLKK